MQTEAVTQEVAVIELPPKLQALAASSGLPESESKALAVGFVRFFKDLSELEAEMRSKINIEDPGPEDEKLAGEYRKRIKKQRTTASAYKSEANERVLAIQRLNSAIFKEVEEATKPLEERLSAVENASAIKEAARLDALEATRKEALAPFGIDTLYYDLRNMPEEKWNEFFSMQEKAFNAMEEQRIANEKKEKLHLERAETASKIKETAIYFGDMSESEFGELLKSWIDEKKELERIAEKQRLDRERQENADRDEKIRLRELSQLGVIYPYKNEFGDDSQPLGELSDEEYQTIKNKLVADRERSMVLSERRSILSGLGVFMSVHEIDELSEDQYAKLESDSRAAFELAEQERAENEAKEKLQQSRLSEVTPYIGFGQDLDLTNLWVYTPEKWDEIFQEKKRAYEKKVIETGLTREHELRNLGWDVSTWTTLNLGLMPESQYQGVLLQAKTEFEEKQSQAPDKDKLIKFQADLLALKVPVLTSAKGVKAQEFLQERIAVITDSIDKMLAKM